MSDNPIRAGGLTKVYDGVKAVDGLDLSVGKGQVFGFLGPNGAGKTTTIGMLMGLIQPTAGKCYINDIEVAKNPMKVKAITGYLPDGVGFYATLSARQNLKYFSKLYDMKGADARIAELLKYVGLEGVDKPVGAYSRGMKQRLGLAQALLNDPEVIFLDEPTNGLDPQGAIQFRNIIREQASRGKTILFSSHILEEVRQVCSAIGIILKGRMIAGGTPEEFRAAHKNGAVRIRIKVAGSMPNLSDPRILEAAYVDGSAVIKARDDIREDISRELAREGLVIKELAIEEQTLEEVFLETVYGGV